MNATLKLALFAVALAAVFGLATVAGGAIDPKAASAEDTHGEEEHGEDHMAAMTEETHQFRRGDAVNAITFTREVGQ